MLRFTSLLLVLTLASLPATSALCLAWCDLQPSEVGDCHHPETAAALTAEDLCAVLAGSQLLPQEVRRVRSDVPGLPLAPGLAALGVAIRPPLVRSDWRVVGSSPRAPLVLRL
jgi:hypothetical protein